MIAHPINTEDFLSGKACIVYRNGLDFADADIIGKNVTCALYEDQQTTKTFSIEGVTDENYYTSLLGYPPTIIASDQVVKTFANHPITLKTSIKYHKEYDRDTEQEILALLDGNDNVKDFSWESVCWFVLWFRCLPGSFWKRMELLLRELRELGDFGYWRNTEIKYFQDICSGRFFVY